MAQEQIELEFREEMQQMQQMQMQAQQKPQMMQQNPQMQQQMQQMQQKIEARKAVLIAEMTEEFMKEEKNITYQFDHDPLLKLKSREVDLRAMENKRKEEEGEQRINLDKMKALMNDEQHEEKLEQNEELAELRAGVSLTKQRMADKSKRHDFGRNFKKK